MPKTLKILLPIIGSILLIGVIVFLIYCNTPEPVDLDIPADTPTNYNNYAHQNQSGNYLDCKNGHIVQSKIWVLRKTTLQTPDGASVIHGVTGPCQLTDNYLYYLHNQKLMQRNLSTNETETATIASNVDSFIALEDAVYYATVDPRTYDDALFRYDLSANSSTLLYETDDSDVETLNYHRGNIYVMNFEGDLLQFDKSGKHTVVCSIEVTCFPFQLQFLGDCILYDQQNTLCFVNLITGDTQTVAISDGKHVNDRFEYICNENHIFVSYHATKTNGSFVSEIDHEDNGLWHIDTKTLKKEKLSDETFDALYLFSDDLLIGNQEGEWFRIDTQTGEATPL